MEFDKTGVNALMEITQRPELVFVRGQGRGWKTIPANATWISFRAGR